MRILHLDAGRSMRGGQRQVLALMEGLRQKNHENLLLARRDSPLAREAASREFLVHNLTPFTVWRHSRGSKIVHAHDARSHTLAAILRCDPLVVSRRVGFAIGRGIVSRWKYRQAAIFLAVSRFVADRLMEAGIDLQKVRVVPDGVEVPDTPAQGDEIVALDTEDPQKGSDLLREAVSTMEVKLKFSNDLSVDLPHAKLFVYLTRQEGLGSAALLAMAYGVPVLASRVGGLPEIVIEGRTGVLTGNDPVEIRHKLGELLANAEWTSELGRQGRELVMSRYTLQHMVNGTEAVYQELTCS